MDFDITLDNFIDPVSSEWRSDIVHDTFLPFEAEKILRIHISHSRAADKQCWVHRDDGILRVKDVYAFAFKSNECASCSTGFDPILSKIWKLKVPPKVRDFVWRARGAAFNSSWSESL